MGRLGALMRFLCGYCCCTIDIKSFGKQLLEAEQQLSRAEKNVSRYNCICGRGTCEIPTDASARALPMLPPVPGRCFRPCPPNSSVEFLIRMQIPDGCAQRAWRRI